MDVDVTCLTYFFLPESHLEPPALSGTLILGETPEVPSFLVGSCSLARTCQLGLHLSGVMHRVTGNYVCHKWSAAQRVLWLPPNPPQRTLDADAVLNRAGDDYAVLL